MTPHIEERASASRRRLVTDLFEARVREQPEAPALDYAGERVSYAELDARANRLAHWLTTAGVGPEVLVGLCFRRSVSAVVAVLGVLKAGGAFLPLDVSYPPAHVRRILASSGARLVLADPSLTGAVATAGAEVIALDLERAQISSQPSVAPDVRLRAHALAYELYTSGSTGVPKGVMVEHGSLAGTIAGLCGVYGMQRTDRVLQFAPLGFDVSIEELFISLAAGATLVGGDEARDGSLRHFVTSCATLGVTVLELPTAFWHLLVDFLATTDCPLPEAIRLVVIGSEAARPASVRRWAELAARRATMPTLLNAYGLTETTITTHVADLSAADGGQLDTIPIGWPIAGVTQRLLDAEGRPVAHGEVGELHVGGRAVARGYRSPSEGGGERFLEVAPGAGQAYRWFRTGDRVRERPDGALEFIGRADEQLKVRSFRVEPAQVERALSTHPALRQVVVGQRDGDDALVAWIVSDGEPFTLAELQRHVRERLPEYMVPGAVDVLTTLPLGPNGKVDRRALSSRGAAIAAGDRARPELAAEGEGALLEDALSTMWEEVLGVRPASVDEDFLSLGGHSLRATQLLARIRERFEIEVSFGQFMRHPTIAGLARLLGAEASSAAPGARR